MSQSLREFWSHLAVVLLHSAYIKFGTCKIYPLRKRAVTWVELAVTGLVYGQLSLK